MLIALTREPGPALAACELEFLTRRPIDTEKAVAQHRAYQACLADLGASVISLAADPALPDGVFIEDPAVVVDEVAVVTRMAAQSRREEHESVAHALAPYRELHWLREPATLEGGDVLRIGRTFYVGVSKRTNIDGIEQLSAIFSRFSYNIRAVEVRGCLHLKTACCDLGDGRVLANPAWFDAESFEHVVPGPADEPWGANILRIGETVVASAASPRTCGMLDRMGFNVRILDISELLKAEAGLTCLSLLFNDRV